MITACQATIVNNGRSGVVHLCAQFGRMTLSQDVGKFTFWNNSADQINGRPWKEGGGPLSKLLSGGDTSTDSLSHLIHSQLTVILLGLSNGLPIRSQTKPITKQIITKDSGMS